MLFGHRPEINAAPTGQSVLCSRGSHWRSRVSTVPTVGRVDESCNMCGKMVPATIEKLDLKPRNHLQLNTPKFGNSAQSVTRFSSRSWLSDLDLEPWKLTTNDLHDHTKESLYLQISMPLCSQSLQTLPVAGLGVAVSMTKERQGFEFDPKS